MKTLSFFTLSVLAASTAQALANTDQTSTIETIEVTGDLQQRNLQKVPSSLSVVGEAEIEDRQASHLEDILSLAPNVNFATGASRGRYFQIRGIGERSQFSEPFNPSVGVMIDNMDFSGIAGVGTLFDVQQVEVFRGPQATEFGVNALGGVIKIKTTEATADQSQRLSLTAAQQNTWRLGAAVGGELTDQLFYRVALQQHRSDGFTTNTYLQRDDTQNIDELTGRVKLRYLASDRLTLKFNYQVFDIDNGYDAFSLENSRQTRSDQPGFDRQDTQALGLTAEYAMAWGQLTAIATHSDSDIGYAYDEDWTYEGFHPAGYSSFDAYYRDRQTRSLEVRASSNAQSTLFSGVTQWTLGAFLQTSETDLLRQYTFAASDFTSQYEPDNRAIYADTVTRLSRDWRLNIGLRVDQYRSDYQDNAGFKESVDDTMVGGKLVLDYDWTDNAMWYAGIYRGYKSSGFNPDEQVSDDKRIYQPEYSWSYETGLKWQSSEYYGRLAVFYMEREDTQISDFDVIPRQDGSAAFIDVIANANVGEHKGLELESGWRASDHLAFTLNLGLLDAVFGGYNTADGGYVEEREQAQSPSYMYSLGLDWDMSDNWRWHWELEGKDAFYFSDGHNGQSESYNLLNSRLSWYQGEWSVSLWGRNLTDEVYYTRGFGGFNNDPRDGYSPAEPYYQLANGRRIGVTADYQF